ncbi:hypothetical protein N7539_003285 [Penicillium diatomitis]|uniref:FCP1 homology domain-containing protein n=1 Tax=Penicillium diatomitis TaxID=2819901 RepID=A0A9W9XH13_9EURO|nr:uncharacterized protein N7539_003285 [Penicillium diatomitis]KAJ5491718.1 hypothetical protein N7539_003285 [Penicillium diatomitis]
MAMAVWIFTSFVEVAYPEEDTRKRQKLAHAPSELRPDSQSSHNAYAPGFIAGGMGSGRQDQDSPIYSQAQAINALPLPGLGQLSEQERHQSYSTAPQSQPGTEIETSQANPIPSSASNANWHNQFTANGTFTQNSLYNNLSFGQTAQLSGRVSNQAPPALPPNTIHVPSWSTMQTTGQGTPTWPTLNQLSFFPSGFSTPSTTGHVPFLQTMPPFNPMLPVQTQSMSTFAGPSAPVSNDDQIRRARSLTPPMKVPSPSKTYLTQASKPPRKSPTKRPLLVILDLNGTLIYRKHRRLPPVFARRHGLDEFLDILTSQYAVMIWTSSKPPTLHAICDQLFTPEKRRKLVALWGRDKFGLSYKQYNSKLQVYKELRKVWASPEIRATFPDKNGTTSQPNKNGRKLNKKQKKTLMQTQAQAQANAPVPGHRWDQSNTVLIDDSRLKALSEPYNILEIPEFTNDSEVDETDLFKKVLDKLDALSHYDDVSKVLRSWNERVDAGEAAILDLEIEDSNEGRDSNSDHDHEEDGGTSLKTGQDHGSAAQPELRPEPIQDSTGAKRGRTDLPADDEASRRERARAKRQRAKIRKQERKAAEAAEAAGATAVSNDGMTTSTPSNQFGNKGSKRSARSAQYPEPSRTATPHTKPPSTAAAPITAPNQKVKLNKKAKARLAQQEAAAAAAAAKQKHDPKAHVEVPSNSASKRNKKRNASIQAQSQDSHSSEPSAQRDNQPSSTVPPANNRSTTQSDGIASPKCRRTPEETSASEPHPTTTTATTLSNTTPKPHARRPVSPVTDDESVPGSPNGSTVSRNSLLDRLEEGLGIWKK